MAVAQGKVVAITGKVIAVAVDGSQRILKAGDIVAVGERLIVPADAAIELQAANGNTIRIAEARDLTITDDVFGSAVADASDAAIAPLNQDAQQVLAALENGQDPLQGLEAAAAGLTAGGGEDGGASFTRIARVAEAIDPLSLDASTAETTQVIEQASTGDSTSLVEATVLAQVLAVEGDDVAEGSNNSFVVTLSAGNVATTVSLQLSSGTATVGEDTGSVRVVINGVEQTVAVAQDGKFSVQLPAGTTSFQVLVDAIDDYLAEKSEAYSLSATANGTEASGTASITDEIEPSEDDTVYAQIEVDSSSVAEGGQLTYTVSLVDKDGNAVSIPAGKEVSVNLAWSGAAVDGNDTSALPGSVIIDASGSTSFTVTAKDDYLQEGSEALVATLTGTGSNTAFEQVGIVAGKGVANSAITDEAIPGPEDTVLISLSGPSSVLEGETTASYSINLSQKAETEVTVTLNYSGTASDGSDYNKQIEVKIPAGADHAEFDLSTLDDAIADNGETIIVTLGQTTGGGFEAIAANPAQSSVTTTIVDETGNDPQVPGDNDSAFSLKLFAVDAQGNAVDSSTVSEAGETSAYYVVRAVDANGNVLATQPGGSVTVSFG
ncbi:retention module-containing protein, partial [Vogesella indigofera]|uniref:retention module-containing protein n=1 Tax=Vogesella indigofera TaxID=45465 RepID=UPI00234F5310